MTALLFTTPHLPPITAEHPPESLPARPEDAGSLGGWVAWCAASTWPDLDRDAFPPLCVAATDVQIWHDAVIGAPIPGLMKPPDPHGPMSEADYALAMATYCIHLGASAAAVAQVDGADDTRYGPEFDQLVAYPLSVRAHGSRIELASMKRLWPDRQDSADLWRYMAALRGDGRQAEKERNRTLPGAVATGQAIHDHLAVVLPQIKPKNPTAPNPRRNSWR